MNYINSKNELYDKCKNMEELYDRYYLYLLSQYELTVLKNQELKKQLKKVEKEHYKKYLKEENQNSFNKLNAEEKKKTN